MHKSPKKYCRDLKTTKHCTGTEIRSQICFRFRGSYTGRKNRFAINLHACKLVANSITNFAINLRMKCFRFATTKFTSNLQAALHNLQIYL